MVGAPSLGRHDPQLGRGHKSQGLRGPDAPSENSIPCVAGRETEDSVVDSRILHQQEEDPALTLDWGEGFKFE